MNSAAVRALRLGLGASIVAALVWAGTGCIFGVDTAPRGSGDSGPTDVGPVDGADGEGAFGDAGACLFLGNSTGVCARGRLRSRDAGALSIDGLDVEADAVGRCGPPPSYEPDEKTCDDLDNDCDDVVDENCGCNVLDRETGVCVEGTVSTLDGKCEPPETFESDETTCDSKDNDCDGTTDEECFCIYNGVNDGVCTNGVRGDDGQCEQPDSFVTSEDEDDCDGKDNDCDGTTDEKCDCPAGQTQRCYSGPTGTAGVGICAWGTKKCTKQGWPDECSGEQTPKTEMCDDSKDNDCDGTTDEGCSCNYDGNAKGVCSGGKIGPNGNCTKPQDYQSDETNCDSKDNDCGGTTDEGCPCDYKGTSMGVCENGSIDPGSGNCTKPGDYEKPEASCDSKDNDCDGKTDGDDSDLSCACTPGTSSNCYTGPSGTKGVGICSPGTKQCMNDRTWGSCSGDTTPKSEGGGSNCDGKDSDCDGTTDEGCPCDYKMKSAGVCTNQTRTSSGTCPKPNEYESPEATCTDSLDNDCDSATDCGDSDCAGKACGTGTGAVCKSGTCTETACNDGTDNDKNGGADCADSDCAGAACGTGTGASCQSGACAETNCSDGKDNDQDGNTDCGDPDCNGETCSGSGTSCFSGDSACHETVCTDGVDNESDGQTDACDSDCAASCGTGASCPDKTAGVCSETDCGDGNDNDNDGDVDCEDGDCSTCGTGTTCSGSTCVETDCADGLDNDGDGDTDCADSDCSGDACGSGTGAVCRSGGCQETKCGDGVDNDRDGSTDDSDSTCDRPAAKWCVNDGQCAVGVCLSSNECPHTIVATSTTYSGSLGGTSGADSKCQSVVGGARPGTWKAVVSNSMKGPKKRLLVKTDVYNTNKQSVAKSKSDLWDGTIANAVGYDESGSSVSGRVWTGSTDKGALKTCSFSMTTIDCNCGNWSNTTAIGGRGHTQQTGGGWLADDEASCSTSSVRLYCIDGQ